MAMFTLKSREFGPQTFYVPDAGGPVRLEQGRNTGELGRKICEGGRIDGTVLTATPKTLDQVARRWWRQYTSRK